MMSYEVLTATKSETILAFILLIPYYLVLWNEPSLDSRLT